MAYIDPNTGGLLFQVLAGGFAVLSAVALVFSRHIRAGVARARRALRQLREPGDSETASQVPDAGDQDL
jgi:hypothetical protein